MKYNCSEIVSHASIYNKLQIIKKLKWSFFLTKCKDPYAKEVSKILFENEGLFSKRKVPIEIALAVYTDCSMGRLTYANECKILQSAGFNILPSWCRLKEEQTAIRPSMLDLPQPHVGVYFPFYNVVKVTAELMLQIGKYLMMILEN